MSSPTQTSSVPAEASAVQTPAAQETPATQAPSTQTPAAQETPATQAPVQAPAAPAPLNDEEAVRHARALDEIAEMNRMVALYEEECYSHDCEYEEEYGGGMDWNESGYFD